MKLRLGFVTNSSSTSYIFARKGDISRLEFIRACGAQAGSPGERLFSVLYGALIERSVPIRHRWRQEEKELTFEEFVVDEFSPGVLKKIELLEADGFQVFAGNLSSDEDSIISNFCVDCFIIEDNKLYLHAMNCVW